MHAHSKSMNEQAKQATKQEHNGKYVPADATRGGTTGNANANADAAKEGKGKVSIWERTAAKLGGHDGGSGSTFRDPEPLPAWLRDP